MRSAGRISLLVALWLLAWGEITLPNVLSGLAVAVSLLVAFPPRTSSRGRVRLHLRGIGRLGGYVVTQLVLSNLAMAREIVRPRPEPHPGVIRHRLRQPSDEAVTLMTTVISLSPGTMTVDVDRTSSTLYVHFYSLRDVGAARRVLERLDRLVMGAITVHAASGGDNSPDPEECA